MIHLQFNTLLFSQGGRHGVCKNNRGTGQVLPPQGEKKMRKPYNTLKSNGHFQAAKQPLHCHTRTGIQKVPA
jgi:hypothetical protein